MVQGVCCSELTLQAAAPRDVTSPCAPAAPVMGCSPGLSQLHWAELPPSKWHVSPLYPPLPPSFCLCPASTLLLSRDGHNRSGDLEKELCNSPGFALSNVTRCALCGVTRRGKGGHPLVASSLSITLNLCFRVETLEHTLPFPITLCTTWHNKALHGGSPGAPVTLCMHPICSGGITGELTLLISACHSAA